MAHQDCHSNITMLYLLSKFDTNYCECNDILCAAFGSTQYDTLHSNFPYCTSAAPKNFGKWNDWLSVCQLFPKWKSTKIGHDDAGLFKISEIVTLAAKLCQKLHSKTPYVVTVLWLDNDDVVTIHLPTSGRLQNLCICVTLIPTRWLCVKGT